MTINASTPWHKESFDRFISESLPRLLAERLPLAGYEVKATADYACDVAVTVSAAPAEVTVVYANVPTPDADGVFNIEGSRRVVLPVASQEDLESADILCVGEQLYDYFERQLGKAPTGLPWDDQLLRSFLPLDLWIRQLVAGQADDRWVLNAVPAARGRPSQLLDECNWLARKTHLRRIMIPNLQNPITHGQFGRVCPFETPEGRNIGRILTIAIGAAIRGGKLMIVDDRPEAGLGLTASMVPFLAHNDPNRQLMGVNMMRQACTPPEPEPAYVQTGNEPSAPDFWCGRNLLTAFVSWGPETFEDAILISESAARRLDYPHALEPGDKLSNRHGTKGTVSRIVPDDQMPHLPDGTAVELAYSFIGLQTRLNFGQVREAVMGRIAKLEGRAAIVRPFDAPSEQELRRRLTELGLPESGMETLTLGAGGKKLPRPSVVGWVYWYRLFHLAAEKLHASVGLQRCNYQGQLEYHPLRDIGAFETIAETFNTRSVDRPDAATLAQRVECGKVEQAGAPSPNFAELIRLLDKASISVELKNDKLTFSFRNPKGETLTLACPVAHPWLTEHELAEIGALEGNQAYAAVVEADRKLGRLQASQAPQALRDSAVAELAARVADYFSSLVGPESMRFGNRAIFSGRTVLSPSWNLRTDQLGLPEEIAWTIFAPLVVRKTGSKDEVEARSKGAAGVLDEIMASAWMILNRAPTLTPLSLLAFHPVRIPDRVIRLHPLACRAMNADFDGDQAAVFLPITDPGQQEAGELLSMAGHLRRSPELLDWMAPVMEAVWGLAQLSRTPAGLKQVCKLATIEVQAPEGFVTRKTLVEAMARLLARDGAEKTLEVMEELMSRGFELTKASGASLSPFVNADMELPSPPAGNDEPAWVAYEDAVTERISRRTDFDAADLGPQLLAVKSGARGSVLQLRTLLGGARIVNAHDAIVGVRYCLAEGLKPDEHFTRCVGARRGLAHAIDVSTRLAYGVRQPKAAGGFTVLARAMRAEQPGIVFAHAAAAGEVDPLTDLDSRLFVGLPAKR